MELFDDELLIICQNDESIYITFFLLCIWFFHFIYLNNVGNIYSKLNAGASRNACDKLSVKAGRFPSI